ncbi:amylo-alpha-1,6-glucosidase [Cetobacterium sp.]|uniref:amylo-alpha-1,6-glucosidase n=1 Tax=Cetobacterium sp. TaxID=2071632 RepID=UPI003F3846EF
MNSKIFISGESLRDFESNIFKEYLVTNGMGSFSSACPNENYSRQYHGLFMRSYNSPINKYMALYKVEEKFNGQMLGTYKKIEGGKEVLKRGDKYLYRFSQNPFPKFQYKVENMNLEKEIIMCHMKDLVGVKYTTDTLEEITVDVLMNFRDIHELNSIPLLDYKIEELNGVYSIILNNEKMYFYTDGIIELVDLEEEIEDFYGELQNEVVRSNIVYDLAIRDRGEKNLDSCKKVLRVKFSGKNNYTLIASFEKLNSYKDLELLEKKELKRLESLKDKELNNIFYNDLRVVADKFIAHKESTGGKTIIAGYPWFNDWGRDTMIAFTGLVLSTGRFSDAKSILKTFKSFSDKGMLPNNFPDSKDMKADYNTIDGTLWYFYGVHKYLEYTKDYEFIENELFNTLKEIIEWHIKGTRYNIKVDLEDGLLFGGDETTQLTWMDVKYKGYTVTPRWGKAVEVNALWYNALKVFENICFKLNKSFDYKNLINLFENNFEQKFLNENGYLNDFIALEEKNDQIRPNQILAVSLPYTILSKKVQKNIVDTVKKHLLTPYGLRSLSNKDKKFIGEYTGSLYKRDMAYHEGTVWTWLIGPFIDAYIKVYDNKNTESILEALKDHYYNDAGLGNISEIFDGEEPFRGKGCYAQAWSIGEILRVYREHIL